MQRLGLPRAVAPALAAGLLVCALVPVAVGAGPSANDLEQKSVQLSARSHAAVLDLYALDSQLTGARARLDSARSQAARVRALRANVALRLRIARHVLTVSDRALADRLRVLYEQGETDPVAVLLGSQSLDEAVTRLDDLHSLAAQDEAVIRQTRQARRSLLRLRGTLAARQRHLDALAGEAEAAVTQLERTRAARSAYVAQLRAEERMNATRLDGRAGTRLGRGAEGGADLGRARPGGAHGGAPRPRSGPLRSPAVAR